MKATQAHFRPLHSNELFLHVVSNKFRMTSALTGDIREQNAIRTEEMLGFKDYISNFILLIGTPLWLNGRAVSS